MEKAKILEKLIRERGYSPRAFAQKCGLPESTLYTILKNGVSRASVNNVIIICKNLGITVEELDQMASGETYEQTYEDMQDVLSTMMARGGKTLTKEQKYELARILMSDDN